MVISVIDHEANEARSAGPRDFYIGGDAIRRQTAGADFKLDALPGSRGGEAGKAPWIESVERKIVADFEEVHSESPSLFEQDELIQGRGGWMALHANGPAKREATDAELHFCALVMSPTCSRISLISK